MSYATLMVYVNADHVSKQFVSVAADVAKKFSANLIGLSALAFVPPFVAEGVVDRRQSIGIGYRSDESKSRRGRRQVPCGGGI